MKDDIFIEIVQVIREDEKLVSFFKKLSSESNLSENLKMTEIIEDLKQKKVSKDIVDAFSMLRKKEILIKLQDLL